MINLSFLSNIPDISGRPLLTLVIVESLKMNSQLCYFSFKANPPFRPFFCFTKLILMFINLLLNELNIVQYTVVMHMPLRENVRKLRIDCTHKEDYLESISKKYI